jgi:hypothetical protein
LGELTLDVSEITFSKWLKFGCHEDAHEAALPGVYMLAHFKCEPDGVPDPALNEIVYIGETTGQTLAKRLYAFRRSAFAAKLAHSGGSTYSERFFDSKPASEPPKHLYVALYGVNEKQPALSKAKVKFIERFCLLRHVEENGGYPECNKA